MIIIRLLIALPILLLLVLFALSNEGTVELTLWPTDFTLVVPLSVAVLVPSAIGFLFGALIVWLGLVGHRGRARRAEERVSALEDEVRVLRQRPAPQPAPRARGTAVATIDG